jgi:hypothetical protein
MTADDISNIIQTEIDNEEKETFNSHGLDLKTCLIKPTQQVYLEALDKIKKLILWTVLEETPDGNGYKIFFDETENSFGLGIKSDKDELIALGIYGPFLNTLRCM